MYYISTKKSLSGVLGTLPNFQRKGTQGEFLFATYLIFNYHMLRTHCTFRSDIQSFTGEGNPLNGFPFSVFIKRYNLYFRLRSISSATAICGTSFPLRFAISACFWCSFTNTDVLVFFGGILFRLPSIIL